MTGPLYTGGNTTIIGESTIVTTWTAKPAPGAVGSSIFVSDVGIGGSEWHSDGSGNWVCENELTILQKAKGWIIPSLAAANAATYSQTGTLISVDNGVAHNIPATNYNTKDVYLVFGTPTTGAQLATGWYSDFQRTGANTFTCVSSISQSGTGTVNTNIAIIPVAELDVTIIGGTMGLNGKVSYSMLTSNNNSANNKISTFKFGSGANFMTYSRSFTTSTLSDMLLSTFQNRNSMTKQVSGLQNTALAISSVDTTIDQPITTTIELTGANDFMAIHSASYYLRSI